MGFEPFGATLAVSRAVWGPARSPSEAPWACVGLSGLLGKSCRPRLLATGGAVAGPLCDGSLASLVQQRALKEHEAWPVVSSLLQACSHLHAHGVLHGDITPKNVLTLGDHIFLGDLGSLQVGDPAHRAPREAMDVEMTTLYYRSPELLLGDVQYTSAIDMWSLGCLVYEILEGRVLFDVQSALDLIWRQWSLFGHPVPDGRLRQLPLYKATMPAFSRKWPPPGLQHSVLMMQMLNMLLTLEPGERAAAPAANRVAAKWQDLSVVLSEVPCARGPCSIAQGELPPDVLEWLQQDPYLPTLVSEWLAETQETRMARTNCFGACEAAVKHEEPGYTSRDPPECKSINRMNASSPLKAGRTAAFVQAFLARNRRWFQDLTGELRECLQARVPRWKLGENGERFFNTCMSHTSMAYGLIQIMRPGSRNDPPHYDGGASLIHGGLTIWGTREVGWTRLARPPKGAAALEWQGVLRQQPGSFYVGNLCAPWHGVRHSAAPGCEPLFRPTPPRRGCTSPSCSARTVLRAPGAAGCGKWPSHRRSTTPLTRPWRLESPVSRLHSRLWRNVSPAWPRSLETASQLCCISPSRCLICAAASASRLHLAWG